MPNPPKIKKVYENVIYSANENLKQKPQQKQAIFESRIMILF
jgi:hypothetical protein